MLDIYRNQIDKIDKKIIELLGERFKVVEKVGEYKKKNNLEAYQAGRWNEVLKSRKKIAKDLSIDENLIEDIWNLIHDYALKLEK